MISAMPIPEGDGTYIVDTEGNIYRKLVPATSPNGYLRIGLRDKKNSRHWYSVHRIVAKAYIPNEKNLPQVNHIDGNKQNNHVENLEWCTQVQNVEHAYRIGLRKPTRSRPTAQIDSSGNVVQYYESQTAAAKAFGVSLSSIHNAITYGRMSCGFYWRWAVAEYENHS